MIPRCSVLVSMIPRRSVLAFGLGANDRPVQRHVVRVLAEVRRRRKTFALLSVFIACAAGALVWLLGQMLIDQQLTLSQPARAQLLKLGAVLVVGGGLLASLIVGLRRMSHLALAKTIEDRYPHFHNRLISYVELSEKPELTEFENEMRLHIGRQADGCFVDTDLDDVVPLTSTKRSLVVLSAVFAALVFFSIWNWNAIDKLLNRALFPWRHSLAATATRIFKIEPGNARVLRNEPVTVTAQWSHVQPESAHLHYSQNGKDWRSARM